LRLVLQGLDLRLDDRVLGAEPGLLRGPRDVERRAENLRVVELLRRVDRDRGSDRRPFLVRVPNHAELRVGGDGRGDGLAEGALHRDRGADRLIGRHEQLLVRAARADHLENVALSEQLPGIADPAR
jgi:hypothetical protein